MKIARQWTTEDPENPDDPTRSVEMRVTEAHADDAGPAGARFRAEFRRKRSGSRAAHATEAWQSAGRLFESVNEAAGWFQEHEAVSQRALASPWGPRCRRPCDGRGECDSSLSGHRRES